MKLPLSLSFETHRPGYAPAYVLRDADNEEIGIIWQGKTKDDEAHQIVAALANTDNQLLNEALALLREMDRHFYHGSLSSYPGLQVTQQKFKEFFNKVTIIPKGLPCP